MDSVTSFSIGNPEVLKIIASFVTGGIFVWLWQLISGHFFINLSVQLEVRRTPSTSPGDDDIVILVKLKKGDRATLALDEIVVWLFVDGKEHKKISLLKKEPLSVIKRDAIERSLNITPGEEMNLACHHTIPKTVTCQVITKVERKAEKGIPWRKKAVWLTSEISTPMPVAQER